MQGPWDNLGDGDRKSEVNITGCVSWQDPAQSAWDQESKEVHSLKYNPQYKSLE